MNRGLHGAALVLAALMVAVLAAGTQAASGDRGKRPHKVKSGSDEATARLHEKLQKQVESGASGEVAVFVTVKGDPSAAKALLSEPASAQSGDASLVVGRVPVQQLPKLAGMPGVVSVGPVELKQTGQPLGSPDPDVGQRPDVSAAQNAMRKARSGEVPYDRAPKPKRSNFEQMKRLAVLDAKTHNFLEAWEAGFAGEGVTVGVLDGGTDFGHPDLLDTWQVWSGAPDSGWNGWPKAFDPYGTLVWLVAPDFVDLGLTWYTKTEAKSCVAEKPGKGPKQPGTPAAAARFCTVEFATRTGPARNFAAPSGTNTHGYTLPASWSRSGTVRLGSHPDDHLLLIHGERPAFVVVDSRQPGVYDTVYVDLDNDYDFSDEKPVDRSSPVSYRDMNGDGYTDLSGGLLYYISDGSTAIPGGLHAFGILDDSYGPGELLAWTGDYDPAIGGHGTLTASNVVGQGVINGLAPEFEDLGPGRSKKGGTYPGAVLGGAPKAKLAPYGDIYFSFDFSTQFGYFLATRNGVDVTSNSYGSSDVDNDGYDAASQEADIWHDGRQTTPLFSTGNGAPGFGTTAPPSPSAGIAVGASTQFGATGWDSIKRYSQVVDNDVMVWSNRGPGATGGTGVDVVADGAFSSGDFTLNFVGDGRFAWFTWGGTSRSAPVAAGATALVYQAHRQATGSIPAGFYRQAKTILKSSSKDLGYDTFIQGAGSVDAGKAVRSALGTRASVTPDEWRVGDYRGSEYPVFTHTIAPGGSDTQTFTVNGPGTWQVSPRAMIRTDTQTLSFTSNHVGSESPFNFNAPDYLIDISDRVQAHPNAALMVVRLQYPRAQFDADADYRADQDWRLLTYNWTDIDRNGRLWTDADGDGHVDKVVKSTSSNIDGFPDIDFAQSELDEGEYVRFMYHRAGSNSLQSFVRDPHGRMADGVFVGLQHSVRNAAHPVTSFQIQIDFYENVPWSWVTAPSAVSGAFAATIAVPSGTPYGMYSGALVLENGGDSMLVPVAVAVGATLEQDADGKLQGSAEFGGPSVAAAQAGSLYNNGSVFGANDWTWRAESGDWRFFFYDVGTAPPEGTLFLTRTEWQDTAPYTDLDTILFGRSANGYQLIGGSAPFGAPYILDTVGSSPNTHLGSGRWVFNTATGGNVDFVTAPAQEGLHALVLHQVGWQGDGPFHVPFTSTVGSATVDPSSVEVTTSADSGTFDVTFEATVDLDGLEAEGYGLSQPTVTTETAAQDNPNDPSSASVKKSLTLGHASRLTVRTQLGSDDLDLFVVYDANGDGQFTNAEIVGSSTTPSSNEFVELILPADGSYQVWVQGWSVSGSPSFTLGIDAIQGNDLTVTGLPSGEVPAGTPVTLTVEFSKAMDAGESYFGELLIGPPSAPSALSVPIEITRTG